MDVTSIESIIKSQICGLFPPRTNVILGESEVSIEWEVPENALNGTYRIMHQGYHKDIFNKHFYSGYSDSFDVISELLDRADSSENDNVEATTFLQRLVGFFTSPLGLFTN